MSGVHHPAICTADVERSLRFWRDGLGLSTLLDHEFTGDWPALFATNSDRLRSIFLGDPRTPGHGFFLLSLQRDVDETLSVLAELGFTDGVRRIDVAAPAGKTVAMAVVTAPDGVLVELIGAAQ
ncbi:VOC family protein [Mycobacterium helveticum]|uniref:VOC family protein n=1 Tax=Mycobacterium helveticum TaxID=2592811 RepID=A0A557XZG5_9MYCO|nr:VOC family protein [Mycobacterium helveticum]TVS88750.1 VOC family protein [Mycobacterium helveticum]TVS91636.1 VOC family protein [Mycobacterium helveticum]